MSPSLLATVLIAASACLEPHPDYIEGASGAASDGTGGGTGDGAGTDGGGGADDGSNTGGGGGEGTSTGGTSSDIQTTSTGGTETTSEECRPADDPPQLVPGLHYAYYEGTWEMLPDFDSLEPVATGTVANYDIGVSPEAQRFGIVFTGFFEVATTGNYTFHVTSDDGSKLLFADALVVDNDGVHSGTERSGDLCLESGRHEVRLEYFQFNAGSMLTVEYEGPDVSRTAIPDEVLFRAP